MFGGGTAKLQLTNPDDVLESGIEIIAQPPGKNISIIEQLSGGEKALIAVSIYFAIMKVNPPPFCLPKCLIFWAERSLLKTAVK